MKTGGSSRLLLYQPALINRTSTEYYPRPALDLEFCNNSYKISASVVDQSQKQGGTMLNEFVLITAVCLAIVGTDHFQRGSGASSSQSREQLTRW